MVDACPACSVKYYIQGSTLCAEKLIVCTVFIFNGRVLCSMYIKFIFIREHYYFNIYRVLYVELKCRKL